MSSRSCPDWPALLEVAPDLHFKHYTVAEAQLPGEALTSIRDIPLEAVALCADLDHNVFNPNHTDARIAAALTETYWYDVREWTRRAQRSELP